MSTNIKGFRLPEELAGKAKYIAWYERVTLTDHVVELLEAHIKKFEKQHGEITPEHVAKAAKKK